MSGGPDPRPPRNERLDRLLAELGRLMGPAEDALVAAAAGPAHPVVLVIGPPRSGTTLLVQWLAASERFAVPSNLLARFSRTPALGARIQALLTDPRYAFGEELFELGGHPGNEAFVSAIGKTRGALAPNEFAFFWRRLLGTQEITPLGDAGVARADWNGIRGALGEIERVLGRPVATKGMFLQYDLAAAASRLPEAFFLRVRRDAVANAAALLDARERYHGDRTTWYSARPPEVERLLERDPVRQVAGQVYFTERAIDAGLSNVDLSRQMTLEYERFCEAPAVAWDGLRAKLAARGSDVGPWTDGPVRFSSTSVARASSAVAPELRAAFAELAAEDVR